MEHLKPRIEDLKANLSLVCEILGKLEREYSVTSNVIDKKRYALQIREKQQEKLNIEQELRGYGVDIPTLKPSDSTCPYRGLMAFEEKDSPNFFGRTETSKALKNLVENYRFVPLSGVSGSGKSSVLFAGLKPLLNDDWLVLNCRPNRNPFYELVQGLNLPNIDVVLQQKAFKEFALALAKGDAKLAVALDTTRRKHNKSRLLLIIDQFEEIYTLPSEKIGIQKAFTRCIVTAIRQINTHNLPITILLAYRADFTGFIQESFGNLLNNNKTFSLNRMSEAELTEAIEKPALNAGGIFLKDGLLQRILKDVGQDSDRLPLLQFALVQLWEKRSDGYLTHEAYDEIVTIKQTSDEDVQSTVTAKGLELALTKYADDTLEIILKKSNHSEVAIRQVFMQLVSFNIEGTVTRRIATQKNIHNWELVKYLADARLVVTGQNAASEQTVEIVHEALIQHWNKLRKWIDADRNFRMWQQGLSRDIIDNALLRDARLVEAQGWLEERKTELSSEEIAFIQASVAQHQAELAEKERIQQEREELQQREIKALQAREKTAYRAFLGTILALFVVSGLGYLTYLQRNNALLAVEQKALAENETQQANRTLKNKNDQLLRRESQMLSETSEKYLQEKKAPVTAMRLALEALPDTSIDNPKRPWVQEAKTALYSALEQHWRGIWEHDGMVNHVQFSPDGQLVLSSTGHGSDKNPSFGNDAYIWEFPSGKLRHVLRGHTQSVNFSYFSPDGKKVLTVSSDDTARLWDVETGKQLLIIRSKHLSIIYNSLTLDNPIFATFSPNGKLIAVTSSDDITGAAVYDSETGKELFTLPLHKQIITSINFNFDGSQILTTSRDNTARIWNAKTGEQQFILNKDEKVFTSDRDKAFLYENPSDNFSDFIRPGITYGEFSRDGKYVVVAKNDGRALLFDAKTGQRIQEFKGHKNTIWRTAFSPDGKRLATGAMDTEARIWDIETGKELAVLQGHQKTITYIGFSPNGQYIVTTSYDKTIKLWSAKDYKEINTLKGHLNEINHAVFSPDSAWLVTASTDKTVRVWNTTTGEAFGVIPNTSGNLRLILKGTRAIDCGHLWSSTGQLLASWDGCDYILTPDESKLLAKGSLYETNTAKNLGTLKQGTLNYTRFSSDGKRIVTALDGDLHVSEVATGKEIATLPKAASACMIGLLPDTYCVDFNHDGTRVLSVSAHKAYKTVIIWDIGNNQLIELLHPESVDHLFFSHDDKKVITTAGKQIYIWDSITGKQLNSLQSNDKITAAALVIDSQELITATTGDYHLHKWNIVEGKELFTTSGHMKPIWNISFSDDRTQIISYSLLGGVSELRAWDIKTGQSLGERTCDVYKDNGTELLAIAKYYAPIQPGAEGYSPFLYHDSMNRYCLPKETGLATIKTNQKFYWIPAYFENNTLITSANQFLGRNQWTCAERREFKLNTNQCNEDSPAPEGMDSATSMYWRMAMEGDAEMQYVIGIKYSEGKGIPVDATKSAEWLLKAAESGHAAAQAVLGSYYLQGTGIKQDSKEAEKWFLKSAEQGLPKAQLMVCSMYAGGGLKNIAPNGNEALKWCRKLLDSNRIDKYSQEHKAEASYAMGVLYQTGRGVERNFEEAVNWHKKAYALGKKDAVTQLKVTAVNPDKLTNAQSEKLGLQVGDIFTEYDGKPVINTDYFIAYRQAAPADSPPKELKVLRNGQILTFPISPDKIGISFENIQ